MHTVNMHEAKSKLSKLVEAVESGTEEEIVIARNGKPAVKIVPIKPAKTHLRLGIANGKYAPYDPDPELDEEIARLMIDGPIFPPERN